MFGVGPQELLIIVALASGSGGIGLPLGMPPLPEDPVLARVAPEQCLWYWSWSGTAKPDPKSKNHTEQLLAESEVQDFIANVEREFGKMLQNGSGQGEEAKLLATEAPKIAKTLLTRPTAVFVSKFDMNNTQQPEVEAAIIVNLGDKAMIDATNTSLRNLESVAFRGAKPEEVKEGDVTWRKLPLPPGPPPVMWGIKGRYLIVTAGKTSPSELIKRGSGSAPAWYTQLRKQLPVERVSMVSYLNLEGIVDSIPEQARGQAAPILRALGLDRLKTIVNVTGLDADGVISRSRINTEGKPTGLLALAEGEPLTADDLRGIPKDAAIATVVRFDLQKGFEELQSVMQKIDPRAAEQMKQEMTQTEAQLGFSFSNDLFGGLGDTWSFYSSPSGGGLLFNGATVVVDVRDRKRLEKIERLILTMVKAMAPREINEADNLGRRRSGATIKQVKAGDNTIHFLNVIGEEMPFAPAWSLTDKELVIGLFPQAVKSHLTRDAKAESLADLPIVAKQLSADPRPVILSYQDTKEVFRLVYPLVQMFAQVAASNMQREGIELDISMLPSASSILPHLTPSLTVAGRTKDGILVETHRSLPTGGGISGVAPMATALLLPAVQAAREAARRSQSMNQLKQIGLAMHNYHDVHKSFPSATTTPQGGNLSWRVQILPFIEEAALFNEFKHDEPWDSEHNKKLIARMPRSYVSPNSTVAGEGKTNYLAIRGKDTIFPDAKKGIGFRDITDGTSKTIMVVEANDDKAVIWTKPDDLELDADDPTEGLGGMRPGIFLALFADGSVRAIATQVDATILRSMFTRNGGEVVQGDFNVADPLEQSVPAIAP